MAGKQDVLDMLEHVGAERIPCGSVHMKFRLPNKKMFVAPSTPSDHLSWDNSLAQLRRELRMTHPEIANWRKNYTPPKNKRSYTELAKTPGISLGELLANHPNRFHPRDLGLEMPIPAAVAIPGSEPVRQEQVHFQIFDEPEPVVVEEVVRTHDAYKPPRIQHEPRPKPAPVKTLTPVQLQEANRRLHEQGSPAMDAYLKDCHEQMVAVAEVPVREQETASEESEMNPMQGLVERTKAELTVVAKRVEDFGVQIESLKAQRDAEVEKQLKLEQFIEKYNKLIEESADVLRELPPLPANEIAKIQGKTDERRHTGGPKGARNPKSWYGIRDIRDVVLPKFRREGKTKFTTDEVVAELGKLTGKRMPTRTQIADTLYAGTQDKKAVYRKAPERGFFELKEVRS